MAALTTKTDFFAPSNRPSIRTRRSGTTLGSSGRSPQTHSPRTPQLGRSISSQFGSPSAYREQEDIIVYELGARHFSAGFAGESRPRCILPFTPETGRRAGDFRQYTAEYMKSLRKESVDSGWGAGYELYNVDLRELDLGLVEDKLDRALRKAMIDYLQLDAKPRKAVLTIPSLLPTPLLEVALKVLFTHFTQPPSIALLTNPIMSCVGAGLRHALVIDVGWEETVVTAVSEYKEISQRRSIRAGKMLTQEMAKTLGEALRAQEQPDNVAFAEAEDITQRMAWCRRRDDTPEGTQVQLPVPGSHPTQNFRIPFSMLADPVEKSLFASGRTSNEHDDHDLALHLLTYRTLLSLPMDLRSTCIARIIFAGGAGAIPGLKRRLTQELDGIIDARGWNPVRSYGSAKAAHGKALKESPNGNLQPGPQDDPSSKVPLSPTKMPIQDKIRHSERVHDDIQDPITLKAERAATKKVMESLGGTVRGVESLGPWTGASLVASLRIRGVHEIDRDDFLKHGLRSSAAGI